LNIHLFDENIEKKSILIGKQISIEQNKMSWVETDNLLKYIENRLSDERMEQIKNEPLVRIAGFDLDDTLIVEKSSKGTKSWKLIDDNVFPKINEYIDEGCFLIIFSNQSGMSQNKNFNKIEWKLKCEEIIKKIKKAYESEYEEPCDSYFAVYAAKKHDMYRKPNTRMWKEMKEDINEELGLGETNGKIKISKHSFYCGDAAGRRERSLFRIAHGQKAEKDHADTDRKFAMNLKINFYDPEEMFIGEQASEFVLTGIDPEEELKAVKGKTYPKINFTPRKKELILFVGPPGSGKTSFFEKYIKEHGYMHVNRDTCKTKEKCIELARVAIDKKKSLVVDNTNPTAESRKYFIQLAQENNYTIRCFVFEIDYEMANHLNNLRHLYTNGAVPKLNKIVYNTYKKYYEEPDEDEGIDAENIKKLKFRFDPELLNDPKWIACFSPYSESLE
jgi:bifunctional polynucleotide phosphatase/kinase